VESDPAIEANTDVHGDQDPSQDPSPEPVDSAEPLEGSEQPGEPEPSASEAPADDDSAQPTEQQGAPESSVLTDASVQPKPSAPGLEGASAASDTELTELTLNASSKRPSACTVWTTVHEQTNAVRKSQKKADLQASKALNDLARRWSEQQARESRMHHNPRLASEVPAGWKRVGENVAAGFSHQSVVQGWRNSPGHFGNMVGNYTHIGIGVGYDSLGRPYYTQVFAEYQGASLAPPASDGPFLDVCKDHKFGTEITWMLKSGLSTGVATTGGRSYQPKGTVSREAMAAFLYRLSTPSGAKAPQGYTAPRVSPFADVPVSHKFYKEIAWMYTSGLSTGIKQRSGKPQYAPKDGVSREAMAAFMFRLDNPSGYRAPGTSPFADVSRSHQFYTQIAWMYDEKLSTGVQQRSGKPKYLPKDRVSREAMAAFLYRAKS
jgi:uncharacterized protein YkwD